MAQVTRHYFVLKCGNCRYSASSMDEDRTKALMIDHWQAAHTSRVDLQDGADVSHTENVK